MTSKKIKYIKDEAIQSGGYVRAWKKGRNFIVQVWLSDNPIGEPDGDWEMPSVLGEETAIFQAVVQTRMKR